MDGADLDATERAQLESMSQEAIANLPAGTNRYADDPGAAALGQALFFDPRFSSDGSVACSTCHDPNFAFSDPEPIAVGVWGERGTRHAPAIINPGTQSYYLWDGRADSLWSQALLALENPVEMDFSRTEVAHLIAAEYASDYEAIFGPLPDLSTVPSRVLPGDEGWEQLSEADVEAVERVFVNAGKAIEAYERKLQCADTRFDRVARGDDVFTRLESRGAADFLRAGCVNCHGGENFNSGPEGQRFHNIGLEFNSGRPDGIDLLLANPINGASHYSDDPTSGAEKLAAASAEQPHWGTFKTPSLRGVGQRPRYFHDGSRRDLADVLRFYTDTSRRGPRNNRMMNPDLSRELRELGSFDARAVEAFLRTLDCPPLPESLLTAP